MKDYRKLDVWAIYRDPEHVLDALKIILDNKEKLSKPLTLFTNCTSSFIIDGVKVDRYMDTLICSEDADIALCLSSARYYDEDLGGVISATPDIIAKFLDKHDISYEIVVGKPQKDDIDNPIIPEIWMAREKYVLEDSIDESKAKGCTDCCFYTDTNATLSMGYYLNDGTYKEIWGLNYSGLIETGNSWTFLINEGDERNISIGDAKKILDDKGLTYIEKEKVSLKK